MAQAVQKVAMDVAKTTAGIVIAKSAKIPEKLDFGDSFAMRNASNGVLYYLISDVIDYVSEGKSSFMTYDPLVIGDDVAFYSLLSVVAELSATDEALQKMLSETLNLSNDVAEALVEGAIISGGRYIADFVVNASQTPDVIKMLRHPLKKILGHVV